jgi:para-nitrobenzyl esterase
MNGSGAIEVETNRGRIRGRWQSNVAVFKGVPYAAPPVGQARFQAPQPMTPWTGVRDALEFGPQSLQTSADLALMGSNAVVGLLFEPPERVVNSEDCLYLNVWTPATAGVRPVMVWCHSGGFFAGSGAAPHCEGTRLSRHSDVVVVTINHRLGLLGFLHLADVGGERYAASGNAGLLDIVAALTWVRDNISAFGGDPNNVTIFGQSGGGAKVDSLLAMPCARGLFHRAIIQSGAWRRFREPDDASQVAVQVLEQLDLSRKDVAKLSAIPAQQILSVQHQVMKFLIARTQTADGSLADRHLGPVLDGGVLPHHPFSEPAIRNSADVSLMIGTTRDEGTFFLSADDQLHALDAAGLRARVEGLVGAQADSLIDAYRTVSPTKSCGDIMIEIITDQFVRMPAIHHAELKSSLLAAPVFMYLFCYETDALAGRLRATHGLEIPFAFDNVDYDPIAGSAATRHELARDISSSWATFARCGVPRSPKAPDWEPYDVERRSTMLLKLPSQLVSDPESQRRKIWQS